MYVLKLQALHVKQQSSTHSAGIVHQFKMRLSSFLPTFRLEEVGRLAQVVVIQSCFKSRICRLWKHTLLLQDRENPHRLERRRREKEMEREKVMSMFEHSQTLHTG